MFEPTANGREHSIREAVFSLVLTGYPQPEQMRAFLETAREAHGNELPAVVEFQSSPMLPLGVIPVQFGLSPGVSLSTFARDGNLGWRLLAQDNQIVVNCLDYEGWEHVWPKVKRYLATGIGALVGPTSAIAGASLQYLNAFQWKGQSDSFPDPASLLRRGAPCIPADFWDKRSSEWHLQQGWFSPAPDGGRILSREHLASTIETGPEAAKKGQPTIIVDLMSRHDLYRPVANPGELTEVALDTLYSHMRVLVRQTLRNYLNDETLERIKAIPLQ